MLAPTGSLIIQNGGNVCVYNHKPKQNGVMRVDPVFPQYNFDLVDSEVTVTIVL
jgi:hypothetical protein